MTSYDDLTTLRSKLTGRTKERDELRIRLTTMTEERDALVDRIGTIYQITGIVPGGDEVESAQALVERCRDLGGLLQKALPYVHRADNHFAAGNLEAGIRAALTPTAEPPLEDRHVFADILCGGCAVREPFEHRCHGADVCGCPECREAESLTPEQMRAAVEAPAPTPMTSKRREEIAQEAMDDGWPPADGHWHGNPPPDVVKRRILHALEIATAEGRDSVRSKPTPMTPERRTEIVSEVIRWVHGTDTCPPIEEWTRENQLTAKDVRKALEIAIPEYHCVIGPEDRP